MYHVPNDKTWNPDSLWERLVARGIPASVENSKIRIALDFEDSTNIVGKLIQWLLPPRPQIISIAFDAQRFIRNIDVQYDPLVLSNDCPHLHDITTAIRECGYLVATDREIAAKYCPDSHELELLFDRMEDLQRQKKELVGLQDFEGARMKRDEERDVRKQIDDFLFEAVG